MLPDYGSGRVAMVRGWEFYGSMGTTTYGGKRLFTLRLLLYSDSYCTDVQRSLRIEGNVMLNSTMY